MTPDHKLPIDHQTLFDFAIGQAAKVNGEFSTDTRSDAFRLRKWAIAYAKVHHLQLLEPEAYGIYYAPDEGEIEELKRKGLL